MILSVNTPRQTVVAMTTTMQRRVCVCVCRFTTYHATRMQDAPRIARRAYRLDPNITYGMSQMCLGSKVNVRFPARLSGF